MSYLTTESGLRIIQENVAGVTGANSLNDTRVESIFTETFTVDPLTTGWLIGNNWVWNAGNGNMEHS